MGLVADLEVVELDGAELAAEFEGVGGEVFGDGALDPIL